MRRLPWVAALTVILTGRAASAEQDEPRPLSREEIEAWLEAQRGVDVSEAALPEGLEAPPPPPRYHGVLVEAGLGALGHLGPMNDISPMAPWLFLRVGVEPLSWLAIFAEGELAFSTTRRASPPPPPRTYRIYGLGAGIRATVPLSTGFGIYAEGSAGLAKVSDDVLEVYGFENATDPNLYFGGRLGLEWYPANPHVAIGIAGGLRSYGQGLAEEGNDTPALAWTAGPALGYRF
ncbi:MAG: hypothetical protein DIU78_015235 [Pseudomonadota bacterium]